MEENRNLMMIDICDLLLVGGEGQARGNDACEVDIRIRGHIFLIYVLCVWRYE